MNFASKKLNGYYKNSEALSTREAKLLAENTRLKKRNKRLSGAMLYLVGHIEKRLPFFNNQTSPATKVKLSPPPQKESVAPKAPLQKTKKKIVGKTWAPQNLNQAPQKPRRKDPLSMQQIFADKKRARDELQQSDIDGSEVVIVEDAANKPSLYERSQAAKADTTAPVAQETIPHTPPNEAVELEAEEILVATAEPQTGDLTPDLAPEEMNILAAPTKDKKQDIFHPQPSEMLTERKPEKTTARDAANAYMAISVAAKPVPKAEILSNADLDEIAADESIAEQVAQQNEVMRAAMLRRVNRLRW